MSLDYQWEVNSRRVTEDFKPKSYYFGYPIEKRIEQKIDNQWKITFYDTDNRYPQRMKQIRLVSPLVKRCTQVKRNVIFGMGWENRGDEIINEFGDTLNDLAWLVCDDVSTHNGFGLFCNFNGLADIVDTKHIPFEFIRYGEPDEQGRHSDAKISNNWEEEGNILPQGPQADPITVKLWNPKLVQEGVLLRDEGQLYYKVPKRDHYPEASFDAVWRLAKSDGEIQQFTLGNLVNGFLGGTLIKVPQDSFESQKEEQDFVLQVQEMIGSYNAGRVTGISMPEELLGNELIETIATSVEPALFDSTILNITNSILQNFGMPGPLVGVPPQGGFLNESQYRDSWKIYNMVVFYERLWIEQCFNQLYPGIGKLKPLEFTNQSPNQNGANQFNQNNDESVNVEGEEEDA